MRFFIILTILFITNFSYAYIPHFWMILSRTAENHGHGMYLLEQDVSIYGENDETLTVHEQWLVLNGERMRLKASGKKNLKDKFDLTFIYDNPRKSYLNEKGQKKALRIHQNWVEPYFHFRFSKKIKPNLHAMGIIPASELKEQAKLEKLEDLTHDRENFSRLSRTNGVITYAFGEKSTAENLKPGLWIEQDTFLVRKLRMPNNVNIEANNYKRYANNFWFPEERIITWGNRRAVIHTTSVKSVRKTTANRNRLNTISLNSQKEPQLILKMPENLLLKEFYSRFR